MVIVLLSVGLPFAAASAETLLDPGLISVTVCDAFTEANYWQADFAKDGRGLSGTGAATTHTREWNADPGYHWVCGGPGGPRGLENPHPGTIAGDQWIAFDLGAVREFDQIRIWNQIVYFLSQYGFKSTYIETSLTGGPDPAEWSVLWSGTLPQGATADGPPVLASATIDTGGVSARYVCITSTDNWGGGNVYGGLSEVQFIAEADPPPPPPPPLEITVGPRTQLSTLQNANQNVVSVSRTGVVAAFYQKAAGGRYYRTSTDRGLTWGPEAAFSPYPGTMSSGLAEGGVVAMINQATPVGGGDPPVASDLESTRILYSDDFTQYTTTVASVSLPNAVMHTKWANFWPVWDKGKMIRLDNGDLLANMYGELQGDGGWYRTWLMQSVDQGQSWQYRASVAHSATDPNPELPGGYCGYCETSIALLANGQLLAMLRTQGSHLGPDYRPLYASWSDDLGLTWTEPEPTSPHLFNVWPTLQVLDNGVVAVAYGRPGVHVAFSTDNGHTWRETETFSTLPTTSLPGTITGYADMVKVGPNDLVMIASHEGGTYVYPIKVTRLGTIIRAM